MQLIIFLPTKAIPTDMDDINTIFKIEGAKLIATSSIIEKKSMTIEFNTLTDGINAAIDAVKQYYM